MMKLIFLAVVSLFAAQGFAQPLDSAPKENYKNPNDSKGLCIEENDNSWISKRGFCKAMEEQMTLPGCASELVEKIRQRIIAEPKKPGQDMEIGINCSTNDNKSAEDLAKNKESFQFLLMQMFSIIAIEESDWDDAAGKGSGKEGLLGLKQAEMKKKEYACGCESKKQENLKPDRPLDGHQNLICGMYMALYNADKDGVLWGSGRPAPGQANGGQSSSADSSKPNPNDSRRGFARIFASLESPKDQNDKAAAQRDDRMQKKMINYCRTHASKSLTTKWKRTMEDIGAESLGNSSSSGTPAIRD